ncbi:MAG TPA: YtxH domain-containing protein [Bryobacteraceae bacterium]|nr:YtxH domain-containing protein [Bryobacteraceae bacterium]
MDKNGFSSFLLGLGVGIGIGMLFAPKAGSETRQLIKDKTGEGTDYLKQRGADLRDSAGDLLNKGKEALNRQKETIADAMEAGRQAYRDAVNPAPQPPAEGAAH